MLVILHKSTILSMNNLDSQMLIIKVGDFDGIGVLTQYVVANK